MSGADLSEPLLRIVGMRHCHGGQVTVHGFDLSLVTGSICCLLGPSGCGKTTVLRCVAGFESLAGGSVRIGGVLMSGEGTHVPPESRRVGMVFQDYALFPHLDVLRNVGFGTRGTADDRARVDELIGLVGLGGMGSRFPHELSGGQQQRVALARALAPQPRLLLLDEPFSNLDVDLREQLASEVRAVLKSTGTTAVFVTHDQNEAFAIADEVAVMSRGRLEQIDTAYNLYHRPESRFVADFIGQGVFVKGTVVNDRLLSIELGDVMPVESIRAADDGSSLDAGSEVDVLLRPDDVVHDDCSGRRATVRHKAFRGAQILYTLELASGTRVLSMVPSHHDHAIGEAIGIRLEMDHLIAFRH